MSRSETPAWHSYRALQSGIGNDSPLYPAIRVHTHRNQYPTIHPATVPVTVTGLTFYDTDNRFGNALASGNYTFSLSTTAKALGGLDTTFANNLGPDNQVIFSGALGGPLVGNSFTVSGTPFLYNPALGNLLLTVDITGASDTSPLTFYDRNSGSTLFSRMLPGFNDSSNSGLVTAFEVQEIPEPSTLLLSGFGLLALLRAQRKKR